MTNIAAMMAMILGDMFGSFELELLWLLGVRSTFGIADRTSTSPNDPQDLP